jgi:putative addiction module killer protein
MLEIETTEVFEAFVAGLKDVKGQAAIASRLLRLGLGLWGDVKQLGSALFELRVHVGPGYRLYGTKRGKVIVVMLCAGAKNTQDRDIAKARALLDQLE